MRHLYPLLYLSLALLICRRRHATGRQLALYISHLVEYVDELLDTFSNILVVLRSIHLKFGDAIFQSHWTTLSWRTHGSVLSLWCGRESVASISMSGSAQYELSPGAIAQRLGCVPARAQLVNTRKAAGVIALRSRHVNQ